MLILKRKNLIIISVLLITVLTFIFCFSALSKVTIGNADVGKVKIVLDAGHGGIDNGVSGVNTKVKESELNLIVTNKLKKYLENAGVEVVLTRSSEAGLYGMAVGNLKKKDMKKRQEIILESKPIAVISIHMNKFSSSKVRGAQVFYKSSDESGLMLANCIQKSFNSMEECVKEHSANSGDYFILNCSEYPSVICECGFLSNPSDEVLLIDDDYQNKIAYAMFKGIVEFLTETTSFNQINVWKI